MLTVYNFFEVTGGVGSLLINYIKSELKVTRTKRKTKNYNRDCGIPPKRGSTLDVSMFFVL